MFVFCSVLAFVATTVGVSTVVTTAGADNGGSTKRKREKRGPDLGSTYTAKKKTTQDWFNACALHHSSQCKHLSSAQFLKNSPSGD